MAPDPKSASLVALRAAREQAIGRLSDAFAHDVIDVDEFERRLTLAHGAASVADVERTVSDLDGPGPTTALVAAPAPGPLAPGATGAQAPRLVAVLGGVERAGRWTVPRRLRATALLGGMVLDLRDAVLPPGTTEIDVLAVMGGVQIVVPPTLSVEVAGNAFMGGFAHVERVPSDPDPERPLLRVRGLALLGGVAVETRLAGESERDAHRRRKRARHALGAGPVPQDAMVAKRK
ncbi:MAG TPA: LiaF domain-containing protein [Polyangiaceae bacterium]|nr:LiaF domain-containing protein [Polyangiaceae bacterium]